MKIFFGHPKDAQDPELTDQCQEAQAKFQKLAPGAEFVMGRDEFAANFKDSGGWNKWTARIGHGVDLNTREPFFAGIVLPSATLGKATADIVDFALKARKSVWLYRDGNFEQVTDILDLNKDSYQAGWVALTAREAQQQAGETTTSEAA